MNKKLKNNLINFILLFAVIIIFFLICEVVLRTTHLFNASVSWSEPDPVIKWRYTPHSYYWFNKENDHPITGYINNFGWRDENWEVMKPPNVYRIAVLGDSYVEALQVESERTFLNLAENRLNNIDKNKQVELMNFGRSGFTQTEQLIVLKNDITQFSPDMVILFFLPSNDIMTIRWETGRESRPYYHIRDDGTLVLDTSFAATREYKIKTLVNPLKQRSALISLIAKRYNLFKRNRNNIDSKTGASKNKQNIVNELHKEKTTEKVGNMIPGFLSLTTSKPDKEYLASYDLNKRLIKEMTDYCSERGIRLMLVTIDNVEAYIPALEQKYKSIDPTFNANFFDDDMREFATALDIDYLGLNRIFTESYVTNGKLLHWGHWNYNGHELVADVLAKKLKETIYPDQQKEMMK